MAILSSHLLNSVNGKHAGKVKIKIFIIDQNGNKDIFLESIGRVKPLKKSNKRFKELKFLNTKMG